MAILKRLVCLANTLSPHPGCFAGKEMVNDHPEGWLRVVPDDSGVLSTAQFGDRLGLSSPVLLDVIDVHLAEARPMEHQKERWLVDSELGWRPTGRYPLHSLPRLVDPEPLPWPTGSSTQFGLNDQVPVGCLPQLSSSLHFVHPANCKVSVLTAGADRWNSRRRVQASFRVGRIPYRIWVTDSRAEIEYLRRPNGDYEIGATFITISAERPYRGYGHLFAAAIMGNDGSHS